MKFYPRSWAKYSEARPGTLKLVPPEYRFEALKADYRAMRDMIYGEIPSFSQIIDGVRSLETEVNNLKNDYHQDSLYSL